jgi:hypothetical protein
MYNRVVISLLRALGQTKPRAHLKSFKSASQGRLEMIFVESTELDAAKRIINRVTGFIPKFGLEK